MSSQKYWTWDENRQKYFHQELNPGTNTWETTWRDPATPRYVAPAGHSQPQQGNALRVNAPISHQATPGMSKLINHTNQLNIHQTPGVPGNGSQYQYTTLTAAAPSGGATFPRHISHVPQNSIPSSLPISGATYMMTPAYAAGRQQQQYIGTQNHGSATNQSAIESNKVAYLSQGINPSRAFRPNESRGGESSKGVHSSSTAHPHSDERRTSISSPATSNVGNFFDPTLYKQIPYKTHKVFVVGKVFMMLYIENAGPANPEYRKAVKGSNYTTVAPGEVAYSTHRRFIVVKEMSDEHYCYCCPITTYSGKATTKPGVDPTAHTIVYTGKFPPKKLEGEQRMNKDPIRIVPLNREEKLDSLSRINLGKVQPIQHNWKIRVIGDVHEKSLPKLIQYRKAVQDR